MFNRSDLFLPQQEIIATRNTNRDSWVGQCEVFNKNPYECVGVMVRQLVRNYHYNYRLLEGSSFLLQPSGSVNDFHCFRFMVVFNDDKGGAVGDIDKMMKGADREEIERMVEKGHSMLLEDLCIVYGNVLNSTDWKSRLERFAPYKASIRVRIPSLPFCKRRTILIPEVGTQNHRVNESNDILQDTAVTHQEELDQGYQQIRRVLRIKKFTDFEIRAQKLFRNFCNPSEPYKAEHAEVFPNRYIQFKRETRIQLKKGKRSYNPWIGEVTIRNHAPSHYLIYKLRTTAPHHYVVMPTEGVLMPRFRRKMFSLKYQTSKFTETLEHLNKTTGGNVKSINSQTLINASGLYGDDHPNDDDTVDEAGEKIEADVMMDKKFMRFSISRSAPQNKICCENHRFADTQNFASLARDTLNEKQHEEQADSVSIRFLYSDVIAEGEALSTGGGYLGGKTVKKKQPHQQQPKQQTQQKQQHQLGKQLQQQQMELRQHRRTLSFAPQQQGNHYQSTDYVAHNSCNVSNFQEHLNPMSSTSDMFMDSRRSVDVLNDRLIVNMFQSDVASGKTSRSLTDVSRSLYTSSKDAEGEAPLKTRAQKSKDLATWMKMTTERSAEVKDEKNHVQSHVFLLDVAFVDPYAVDERNYNIEELFRHTETLTGGYKMSRCFYPYFVPEDTISGPVIVYPKNDVVIERGIGSPHVHWMTEIYLVNIYKSSLYYCIIPQEEDYGQLEVGDEILITPKRGLLLHYSEKRRFDGMSDATIAESLCEQIQIYLRYTRPCFMEDGPIFKLHIFFFTEAEAPEWLKNPNDAENLDVSNPNYCNPLSRALDVVTVHVFIKDAEQQVAAKNSLNYDDLDDTEDVFRPLKGETGQWSEPPHSPQPAAQTHSTNRRHDRKMSMQQQSLLIQDTASTRGIGELLHQTAGRSIQHPLPRDPRYHLPVEFENECDALSVAAFGFAQNALTPGSSVRAVGRSQPSLSNLLQSQESDCL